MSTILSVIRIVTISKVVISNVLISILVLLTLLKCGFTIFPITYKIGQVSGHYDNFYYDITYNNFTYIDNTYNT